MLSNTYGEPASKVEKRKLSKIYRRRVGISTRKSSGSVSQCSHLFGEMLLLSKGLELISGNPSLPVFVAWSVLPESFLAARG